MKVIVLGIRGVPAQHGGFETFTEYLCEYLTNRSWDVTVYCQEKGTGAIFQSKWRGVNRVHIPVKNAGPLGTIIFDFRAIVHSLRYHGVFLTLGYNTAVFNVLYRLRRKTNLINMDGIEWKRQKWGFAAKAWFFLNERFGCWFSNSLIADHPLIADHLATRVARNKITMIPYGGRALLEENEQILADYDLQKYNYAIVIARAEPENSILEIVTAFSTKIRNFRLIVLGDYSPGINNYHKAVIKAASDEVIFPGAIYEEEKIDALRYFARVYVHGHQVGGTNPSLVEALGAGNAVLAHNNKFNRWVTRNGAIYFNTVSTASAAFDRLFMDDKLIESLQISSKEIFQQHYQWDDILHQYEQLLTKWFPQS